MPLIFHEMGHSDISTGITKASVNVFLEQGVKSRSVLKKEGVISYPDGYERHQAFVEEWKKERKHALKDDPEKLVSALKNDEPKCDEFYKPENLGNREESVFFGYNKKPCPDRDWIAIEASDDVSVHDASCRDDQDYRRWNNTAVSLTEYEEHEAAGTYPGGWTSRYNEIVIRHAVPSDRIIAYAQIEKELDFPTNSENIEREGINLHRVKEILNQKLSFSTQFESAQDNILIHKNANNGKYEIRVSFNKEKAQKNSEKIKSVFDSFDSFDQLQIDNLLDNIQKPNKENRSAKTLDEIKQEVIDKTKAIAKSKGIDDSDAVNSAYRQLCLNYHPDKQIEKTDVEKEEKANEFLLLKEAFKVYQEDLQSSKAREGGLNFVYDDHTLHKNIFTNTLDGVRQAKERSIETLNHCIFRRSKVRGNACEKEATVMVHERDSIRHLAVHHDSSNALLLNITEDTVGFAGDIFLVSDKHNACPMVLIKCEEEGGEVATILWHVSYTDLYDPFKSKIRNVDRFLPKQIIDGEATKKYQALQNALSSKKAQMLTTDETLLNSAHLSFGGSRSKLELPGECMIRSSGRESQIRSYSVNYFPKKDILILSGYDYSDKPTLWVMNDPFMPDQCKWNKISGEEFNSKFTSGVLEHLDCTGKVSALEIISELTAKQRISSKRQGLFSKVTLFSSSDEEEQNGKSKDDSSLLDAPVRTTSNDDKAPCTHSAQNTHEDKSGKPIAAAAPAGFPPGH